MTVVSPAHSIQQIEFELPGMTLAGLRSNRGQKHRVLAAHGWLDNANSFLPLMPLLPETDLVAIDLPGHGYSGHLGHAANYHFLDIVNLLFDVASNLRWDSFNLMGHSLGACAAPFAAVANPDRLLSVIMLEATGPLTESASELPARLRRSFQDRTSASTFRSRVFANMELAIEARLRATTMSRDAARLIIERQLVATDGGFRWRFDPRHRMASPMYMMEEQVLAVIDEITCPVLTVTAEDGYLLGREQTATRFQHMKTAIHHRVPGHHHMHMDDPVATAQCITPFLAQSDP